MPVAQLKGQDMKPIRTWIVVANARQARIIEHHGAGHGLHPVPGMALKADPPGEYSDRPGTGHSIAGPGVNAVGRPDPQEQADLAFAHRINDTLCTALDAAKFDRLLIVAGPHLLGLLRKALEPALVERVLAEVDKDLTALPLEDIEKHLDPVMLV